MFILDARSRREKKISKMIFVNIALESAPLEKAEKAHV